MHTIARITTFTPSPMALAHREEKISSIKQEMGRKWLLHPDNYVKKQKTQYKLLTKWISGRI